MRVPSTSLHSLDSEQQDVSARLDQLGAALITGEHPRGIYVHGAVGRGKTWLCDRFFAGLPTGSKRRVHFHGFFRQLHRDIWSHRLDNPTAAHNAVDRAVADLLHGVDLLYFDEFHVHDSGDAALVLRVLDDVLASDVTLLATSNYAPSDLLPGPFHHVFERGIHLIEQRLDVVELGGDHDYRLDTARGSAAGFASGAWLAPGTDAQLAASGLRRPTASDHRKVSAGGHHFTARRADAGQLWFTFAELCERDTSVADYLHWTADFDNWVLEGVPRLSDTTPQAAKRFGNLVDVLCDQDLTLHVLSEHPLSALFDGDDLPLDSARTASRLTLLANPGTIHTQP